MKTVRNTFLTHIVSVSLTMGISTNITSLYKQTIPEITAEKKKQEDRFLFDRYHVK